MLKLLESIIKDKKVLILGFGREGKSTYNMLKKIKCYKELAISDMEEFSGIEEKMYSGENYLDVIKDYDIVFKSPGIYLKNDIDIGKAVITSQVEVFIKKYGKQVIGITGTKGKSTVTSLIYHVLKESGKDVVLAGNIGIPVFDTTSFIKDETIVVLELSCHQLEYCKASPKEAIFLNIYEEHLDHYIDFEAYYNAKKNIYKYQDENSMLYCDDSVKPENGVCKSEIIVINKENMPYKTYDEFYSCKLIGEHNLLNINFAYEVLKNHNINDAEFKIALSKFKPLPHRLEYIGEKDGIKYYDDSISTAVESCIRAIESVKDIDTILIGGLDRGINYDKLADYLLKGKVRNVICMYASGSIIFEKLKDKDHSNITVEYCEDLYQALDTAKNVTEKGKACVLSPAAASYGYFKNFEERGDKFKEYIFSK